MLKAVFATLLLCLVFALGASVALFVGRQQPIPSRITALHLTDCLPPCWIGIVPGKTTIGEARNLIVAAFQNSNDYDATFDYGAPTNTLLCMLEGKKDHFALQIGLIADYDLGDESVIKNINLVFSPLFPNETAYVPTFADLHSLIGLPTYLLVFSSAGDAALQYGNDEDGVFVYGYASAWADRTSGLEFYNTTGRYSPLSYIKSYPWAGFSSPTTYFARRCNSPSYFMC